MCVCWEGPGDKINLQRCPFNGLLLPLKSYLPKLLLLSKRVSSGGGHLSQIMSLWEILPIQAIKICERKFVFADSRFYERTGNM